MARKFSELRSKMSAESQARAKARTDEILQEMRLAELRRARDLTQQQIATDLHVNQAWISKVERQTDMYLSTLRTYVQAMGGELELIARFGDKAVRINQLNELDVPEQAGSGPAPSANAARSNATGPEQMRVAIYPSARDPAARGPELFHAGPSGNTGRSRTPDANTSSATTKAA